jgi:hypothetical protein
MSAPLSALAIEVLRAVALGLRLRETEIGWQFVGPFQNPGTSRVDTAAVSSLLDGGFLHVGPTGELSLTEGGERALAKRMHDALQAGLTSSVVVELS